MPEHIFFYLAFAFILTHELDAMRCKEWRILPGLSKLQEKTGIKIFILAHIPLYSLIFLGLISEKYKDILIIGLDIFFIIHLILHLFYLFHSKNEFKDFISWSLISGAAFFGILDLVFKFLIRV